MAAEPPGQCVTRQSPVTSGVRCRLGDGGGATEAVRYEAEPRNEQCEVQVG